jgi:hypothetical protein
MLEKMDFLGAYVPYLSDSSMNHEMWKEMIRMRMKLRRDLRSDMKENTDNRV